ncbi:MAG: transcription antitermination factor NusB [Clostridia bacterium]|nr:transcription antitermination factor NusB [Clostridia bacterium]
MNRKTARDLAFKLLYQVDIQKEDGDVIFDIAKDEYNIDDKSKEYIGNILYGVEENAETINDIISKKSEGWKLNRISKISLACLRLGIFEILYCDDIPDQVAANEAVGIAKLYEGEESARFVNGILSVIIKEKA